MRFLSVAVLLFVGNPLSAALPADPLRFIPDKADLVIKIENPRQLLETITTHPAVLKGQELEGVRPLLDTAQVRRFFEFIAYYERDFGMKWPELLDKLAGGGIVLGSKIKDGNDDPVLFAVQATDEALLIKFIERATELFKQELARADAKDGLTKEKYQNWEVIHLGKDLHACRIDSALLFSNKLEGLKAGIDQHVQNISKGGKPAKNMLGSARVAAARKLLPPNPNVWLWYGFDYLKQQPQAMDLLKTPRDNTILTFLFAGYLDIARRADFLAIGLYLNKDEAKLAIRMPAGRDGMAEDVQLHLPRDPKVGGTLPLLEPDGTLLSHSFYLDLATFWEKRAKIMNASNAKDFEKGVKDAGRFLPGTSLEKLFMQSGVHHRLVAVQRPLTAGYKVEPQVRIPAFAFVTTMRDPAFARSMEVLIRGGLAFASTQVSVQLLEETHAGIKFFGYRFPEDGKFPDDPQGLRFNFTPCYAVVNDQAVFASTREFCRELIDLLQAEKKNGAAKSDANMQARLHATGLADLLNAAPEQLLTQTILAQAVPEAEAKKQVEQLLTFLRTLGRGRIETNYSKNEFHFDIEWKFNK